MRSIYYIYLLALLLTLSCGRSSTPMVDVAQSHIFIDIDIGKSVSFISPDSVFSNVEYIPLETQRSALIGDPINVTMKEFNNLYYILESGINPRQKLFVFHEDGNLVNVLDREGRGPGEYLHIKDFYVKEGVIYLLLENKIMKYSADLNHIGDIPLSFVASAIAVVSDNIFLHSRATITGDKFGMHVIDMTGDVVNQFFKFDALALPHNPQLALWVFNDTVYAEFNHDYNVYQITPERTFVYATVDFGKDNMSDEIKALSNYTDREKIDNYVFDRDLRPPKGLGKVLINNEYLIIEYYSFLFDRYYILNRKTGIVFSGPLGSSDSFPFVQGSSLRTIINNNKLASLVSADRICKYRDKNTDVFPDQLKGLEESDNPVLVIYTLR